MVTRQSYRVLTFMWNTKYQTLWFAMLTTLRDNAMESRWPRTVSLLTTRWALFKLSNSTRLVTLSIWFMLLEASRLSTTQTQRSRTWSWRPLYPSTLQGMMSQSTQSICHSTMLTSRSSTGLVSALEVEEESISTESQSLTLMLSSWPSQMSRNNAS